MNLIKHVYYYIYILINFIKIPSLHTLMLDKNMDMQFAFSRISAHGFIRMAAKPQKWKYKKGACCSKNYWYKIEESDTTKDHPFFRFITQLFNAAI